MPILKNPVGAVGQIMSSMLTLSQFQTKYGTDWILADGSSCSGSAYEAITSSSTVPDLRGMALRGKNNGRADGKQNPDGDLALGTYQADAYASHTHSTGTYWDTNNFDTQSGGGGGKRMVYSGSGTSAAGENETRSKNITVNFFIRIN